MKISILTLFPQMFIGPFSHSIVKRALEKKAVSIEFVDIRDFGIGKHKMVDDTPYGGGAGMLMRVDVLDAAINHTRCKKSCRERVILMDAGGQTFTQEKAHTLTSFDHLILICAHYEGIDERIRTYIDEEISIGDFVLTGGEIPAMAITDAIIRLIPGVLGKDESSQFESFQLHKTKKQKLLEHPHFTKPVVYKGETVPDILRSGHHANIEKWRDEQSLKRTNRLRPDLVKKR